MGETETVWGGGLGGGMGEKPGKKRRRMGGVKEGLWSVLILVDK